ncbi:hypothetical protein [Polaribacter sp. Hel_I_88]|uniref:hypothetical protein n=1 Tax=Polaribacter sp. Hel_I_88 TaxID=1250006 RepID=UPI000B2D9B28|nr:hypothetical protein [Polaribacter sp. Hel_I_88]
MSTKEDLKKYISNLKEKLKEELPRISEEIRIYEEKLNKGELTPNPTPGPQFNG